MLKKLPTNATAAHQKYGYLLHLLRSRRPRLHFSGPRRTILPVREIIKMACGSSRLRGESQFLIFHRCSLGQEIKISESKFSKLIFKRKLFILFIRLNFNGP